MWTFARDRYGRLRADRGERWDEAELALIRGLEPHGFRDAVRTLHGYAEREPSWEWPRWGGGDRLSGRTSSNDASRGRVRPGWRRARGVITYGELFDPSDDTLLGGVPNGGMVTGPQ